MDMVAQKKVHGVTERCALADVASARAAVEVLRVSRLSGPSREPRRQAVRYHDAQDTIKGDSCSR